MGDRGNIAVLHKNGDQIWLYSHWGGSVLPSQLKAGLKAFPTRWTDESYLTKIIFGHAVPPENWTEETGFGISGCMQDNEYPINVVDIPNQRVYAITETQLVDRKVPKYYTPSASESFTAYVA